jgi:thioredoxin-dependent peroxiredoxin
MSEPIQVGVKAPDFTLPSHTDEQVSLSRLLGEGKNVVLFFYPLDWTPV